MVDVKYVRMMKRFISLKELKKIHVVSFLTVQLKTILNVFNQEQEQDLECVVHMLNKIQNR